MATRKSSKTKEADQELAGDIDHVDVEMQLKELEDRRQQLDTREAELQSRLESLNAKERDLDNVASKLTEQSCVNDRREKELAAREQELPDPEHEMAAPDTSQSEGRAVALDRKEKELRELEKYLLNFKTELEDRERRIALAPALAAADGSKAAPEIHTDATERQGDANRPICPRCSRLSATPPQVVRMRAAGTKQIYTIYACPNKCGMPNVQLIRPGAKERLADLQRKKTQENLHPPTDQR